MFEFTAAEPIDSVSDRVKLPQTYDVQKMYDEVQAMGLQGFVFYNVVPLRAPAHQVDPSRPFPPPADDYADGSWTDWLNTPQLEAAPYLKGVIEEFQKHTNVTLIRVLRLEPGQVVQEHTDPTLGLQIERSVIRLTIPIQREPEVEFHLNGSLVPMKPGELWYMRLTDPHKVVNNSDKERISITIDMTPSAWVQELIASNDVAMA